MKSQLLIISFFLLPFITKSQNATISQFSDSISVETVKPHLETLASDQYEGRESGKQGQKMAAKYIRNHFQEVGLKPINTENAYLQPFYFMSNNNDFVSSQDEIKPLQRKKINKKNYYYKKDFELLNEELKIVWLDSGFDYSTVNVKDKIVVVLLKMPADSIMKQYNLDNSKSSEIKSFNLRSQLAKVNGAKGIFFIHPTQSHFDLYKSRHLMMSKMNQKAKSTFEKFDGFPIVYFKPESGRKLLKLSAKKFDLLLKDGGNHESEISMNFMAGFNKNITENVIGILPGTTNKDEYVFVTAHYDHLGVKDGRIYNGADDNASGTSALLALAETFSKANKAGYSPKRNIVFVAFSGEELGLLGSEFLTNNLDIPHHSIYAVYNVDMIGRARKNRKKQIELYILGEKICTDKNAIIVKNHFPNILLDYEYNSKHHSEKMYYRSDHYNFARFGIDFIYFTTGFHSNYHLPSDDSDKIDYESLTEITRLIFRNVCSGAMIN